MSPLTPKGRHRLQSVATDSDVRRVLMLTLLGAGAAVGPVASATAGTDVQAASVRVNAPETEAQAGPAPDAAAPTSDSTSLPSSAASAPVVTPTSAPTSGASTPPATYAPPTAPATTRAALPVDGPVAEPTAGPQPAVTAATAAPAPTRTIPGSGSSLGSTVSSLSFAMPAILPAGTDQVITVQSQGTYATVSTLQLTPHGWTLVASTTAGRVGANGVVNGATRVQGTDTTPTGIYSITEGFGVGANPGTKMPYHQVTDQDWWVEDPTSAYYNQMRTTAQGGFHLTETGDDGSEHLIEYPTQYHNALVVNYNMDPAVPGRGAGIFLHDLGPQAGPTAGCIAVPQDFLTQVMDWIDPAQHPVIAIS